MKAIPGEVLKEFPETSLKNLPEEFLEKFQEKNPVEILRGAPFNNKYLLKPLKNL